MDKKTLLDAYNALEAQIKASNNVIGMANAELNDKFKDVKLDITRNGRTMVLAQVTFNLSVWGNSMNIYFVNYDLHKLVKTTKDLDRDTKKVVMGYIGGFECIETACNATDPALGFFQNIRIDLDNEMAALLASSQGMTLIDEDGFLVLRWGKMHVRLCPIEEIV